jgi:hypothetical protein
MIASRNRPRRASERAGVGRRWRIGDRVQGAEGQGAGERDQRQQTKEDIAPADRVAHGPRDGRADHAGQDPGGRERGEHPWPERFGERPPDGDVGDRLDRARTEPLQEPGTDQDRHRRRQAADQQPDREQAEADREGDGEPATIDRATDDDDADQRTEEERREDPTVELEVAELLGDDRHDLSRSPAIRSRQA